MSFLPLSLVIDRSYATTATSD